MDQGVPGADGGGDRVSRQRLTFWRLANEEGRGVSALLEDPKPFLYFIKREAPNLSLQKKTVEIEVEEDGWVTIEDRDALLAFLENPK